MCRQLLADNWETLTTKVIKPLWFNRFKSMYESSKMTYDDFESLAGYEFTKAFQNFNDDKANLYTYAATVLNNKAKSELRDCNNRDKRKALTTAISIDVTIDGEEDDGVTFGDCLTAKEEEDISPLTQRYLDSLTSKQRQVAELMMSGYMEKDIKETLGLSNERYKLIVMNMKTGIKITPLKILKERMK